MQVKTIEIKERIGKVGIVFSVKLGFGCSDRLTQKITVAQHQFYVHGGCGAPEVSARTDLDL